MSHPTWVRGLKPLPRSIRDRLYVAPYVGAWIETLSWNHYGLLLLSHPTWVRGLKLYSESLLVRLARRTLRGCVD